MRRSYPIVNTELTQNKMCYQCLVAGRDGSALADSHSLGDIPLRTIAPELLILPSFKDFTTQQVVDDGIIDLYLHRPAGPVDVSGGFAGAQTIQALELDDQFYEFIIDSVEKLDTQLDIEFRLVNRPEMADVRFYLDTEIVLGEEDSGGVVLGIALANENVDTPFWEILLNTPAFEGDLSYLYFAALHELGHTLGLEHPFDDSDGDVFESSSPSLSAYPEETLMAYRSPLGKNWPTAFTFNDLAALQQIWGEETEISPPSAYLSQKLFGTASDDVLTGGLGSDLISGESGNDVLIGGGGVDELFGGFGSNKFVSKSDDFESRILISRDGSKQDSRNQFTVDEIAEVGIEDKIGVLGASTRQLRFLPTLINSASLGRLDGVGIYVGKRLEAVYTGGDLTISEIKRLTVGLPATFTGELG